MKVWKLSPYLCLGIRFFFMVSSDVFHFFFNQVRLRDISLLWPARSWGKGRNIVQAAREGGRLNGQHSKWLAGKSPGFQEGNASSKGTIFPLPCKFTRRYIYLKVIQQIDTFFGVCDFFWTHMLLVATWGWKEHRENDGWFQQIRSKHGYWGSFEELRSKRCGISWYLFPLWGCDAWGEHREKFSNFCSLNLQGDSWVEMIMAGPNSNKIIVCSKRLDYPSWN